MTFKQAILFIGKCLTIDHEEKNKILIENDLKSGNIDWEAVVKISTDHLVFPPLYCNLKRADFLHYLPQDLINFMQHITDLNRERNKQIVEQAKELNTLLLQNDITPIFIKGTSNLLEGLYEDIAERMLGDIDILISEENYNKADKILRDNKYSSNSILYGNHRHLPRLTHPEKIAAVEIHKTMLIRSKSSSFNYKTVTQNLILVDNFCFLSVENKIKLSVLSNFINDNGYQLKSINLKTAYDIFCFFQKTEINTRILKDQKLQKELSAGLMLYATILNKPNKICLPLDEQSKKYVDKALKKLEYNPFSKLHRQYLFIAHRFDIFIKAFYKKSYFNFVYSKFMDRKWYRRRFGI